MTEPGGICQGNVRKAVRSPAEVGQCAPEVVEMLPPARPSPPVAARPGVQGLGGDQLGP